MDTLQNVVTDCQNTYQYHRQYADTSDIQAERSLNAEAARCQGLQNEYETAKKQYQNLSQ
jgi:hypothetical protein